jgi:hypothetical protein
VRTSVIVRSALALRDAAISPEGRDSYRPGDCFVAIAPRNDTINFTLSRGLLCHEVVESPREHTINLMTLRAVVGELIGHGVAHGCGDLDGKRPQGTHRLGRQRTGQQAVILLQHGAVDRDPVQGDNRVHADQLRPRFEQLEVDEAIRHVTYAEGISTGGR